MHTEVHLLLNLELFFDISFTNLKKKGIIIKKTNKYWQGSRKKEESCKTQLVQTYTGAAITENSMEMSPPN